LKEKWTDPYGREKIVHTDVLPSQKYGTLKKKAEPKDSKQHLHSWQWYKPTRFRV
jgi:hypothetical protein